MVFGMALGNREAIASLGCEYRCISCRELRFEQDAWKLQKVLRQAMWPSLSTLACQSWCCHLPLFFRLVVLSLTS